MKERRDKHTAVALSASAEKKASLTLLIRNSDATRGFAQAPSGACCDADDTPSHFQQHIIYPLANAVYGN
jgi:hypothetical protein